MNKEMNIYIEEAIKSIAETESLINYSTETSSGSVKGDGYMGIIKTLKITGVDNKNVPKTINCIVKSAPQSEALRSKVPVGVAFESEIYAYNTIFPALNQFEIAKQQLPTRIAPKFYYAISSDKNEAIIMDNLKESGYRLHTNDFTMDDAHVRLVFHQYARFHASSLALHDQQPKKFQQLAEKVNDSLVLFLKTTLSKSVHSLFDKAIAALDVERDSRAIEIFKSFVSNVDNFYDEVMSLRSDERCAILHGDCWNNNMMFKYGDLSDPTKPTSVKFLDFQVQNIRFPVFDLTYFFYSSSSSNVIDSYEKYLDFYYQTFSDYLEKLGSDSKTLYSYELFMEHWKKYAKFTFCITPLIVLIGSTEQNQNADLVNLAESSEDMSSAFAYQPSDMDGFNERLRYLILHFVNNNFL